MYLCQAGRFIEGGGESAQVRQHELDGNIFDWQYVDLGARSIDGMPDVFIGLCPTSIRALSLEICSIQVLSSHAGGYAKVRHFGVSGQAVGAGTRYPAAVRPALAQVRAACRV